MDKGGGVKMEPSILWQVGLTAAVTFIGWTLKNSYEEVKRLNILLNKTREDMARDYLSKSDANTDFDRVILRLDALDQKLDRMLER
jgi:hypothetical protein